MKSLLCVYIPTCVSNGKVTPYNKQFTLLCAYIPTCVSNGKVTPYNKQFTLVYVYIPTFVVSLHCLISF
jgi:hypothetical protein